MSRPSSASTAASRSTSAAASQVSPEIRAYFDEMIQEEADAQEELKQDDVSDSESSSTSSTSSPSATSSSSSSNPTLAHTLHRVFAYLSSNDLSSAACVCQSWYDANAMIKRHEKKRKKKQNKSFLLAHPTSSSSSSSSSAVASLVSKGKAPQAAHSNSKQTRGMFADGFKERNDLEQYFWTTSTVSRLLSALEYFPDCCCLTTPTLAHSFSTTLGRDEILLDIDKRFDYLPGFRYWDLLSPVDIGVGGYDSKQPFHIVVFDPPFFYISMQQLYAAVSKIVKGNYQTKLLIAFLKREENSLLSTFKKFSLKRTNFVLEYATVPGKKWANYALYANVDLPGIRREK